MRILIAGDYCPHGRVASLIEQKSYSIVDDEIKKIVNEADYSLINFECPIADEKCQPIEKSGPNLKTTPQAINKIKEAGFSAVTLANNHFRDYGDGGVRMTLHCLKNNNLEYVGGGKDIYEASRTLYPEKVNNVAIINCCEKEFSIASLTQGGSNPLDPIKVYYAIREAKENNRKVIVIVHGGCEHYKYPTPRMVDTYRFFIDAGADAVVNHHQHCFSGYEIYHGKPIFYGLGNFCFDWEGKRDIDWNKGYMVELVFENEEQSFILHPYMQGNNCPGVSSLNEEEKEAFLNEIRLVNVKISDRSAIEKEFEDYKKNTREGYRMALEPYSSRITQKLYSLHLLPSFWGAKKKLLFSNLVRCESHRERLLSFLESKE